MQWLIDLLGVGILIGGFVSFQNNRHKHIVMMKVGTDLMFTVQYLLLGAYSGALMDMIGIVRNLILMRAADGISRGRWGWSTLCGPVRR